MRRDTWDVRVSIDGRDLGTWDVRTGGETDSDELTYKPGGMAPAVSLGGSVTVAAVVVSRLYRLHRDHGLVHWLLGRAGKGKVVVKQIALDNDGNAYGTPLTTRGVLKRVSPPEVDSTSTEAAIIELEITPEGVVT